MEPRGIVKAFPKRKKVRDDSGKSIPAKIPKEKGAEIPEGKSCMLMARTIILQLVNRRCCSPKGWKVWLPTVFVRAVACTL